VGNDSKVRTETKKSEGKASFITIAPSKTSPLHPDNETSSDIPPSTQLDQHVQHGLSFAKMYPIPGHSLPPIPTKNQQQKSKKREIIDHRLNTFARSDNPLPPPRATASGL
jgi:hypothetical protein